MDLKTKSDNPTCGRPTLPVLQVKINVWHRKKARRIALQALYQYFMTREDLNLIEAQFRANKHNKRVDLDYFQLLLRGVVEQHEALDRLLSPYITRDADMLDQIEHIILYIAGLEVLHKEVPSKVIINEAVELAKSFAATDSYKYINAVLNKLVFGESYINRKMIY